MKFLKIACYTLSFIPIIFIGVLTSFYFKAEKILGYFPKYNKPDPKTLDIYSSYSPIINFTTGMWIFSLLTWVLLTVICILFNSKVSDWKPIIICGLVQCLGVFFFLSGIMEWYAD